MPPTNRSFSRRNLSKRALLRMTHLSGTVVTMHGPFVHYRHVPTVSGRFDLGALNGG